MKQQKVVLIPVRLKDIRSRGELEVSLDPMIKLEPGLYLIQLTATGAAEFLPVPKDVPCDHHRQTCEDVGCPGQGR